MDVYRLRCTLKGKEMPNHVQNKLEIIAEPEYVKKILQYIKGDKTTIDFNKILPMPFEAENVTIAVEDAVKNTFHIALNDNPLIATLEKSNRDANNPLNLSESEWTQYINCLNNYRTRGCIYWYDWSLKNWGTKWNAYGTPDERDNETTIYFQTAWSDVQELIIKLSLLFPEALLKYSYADEDSGCNTGKCEIQNGIVINEQDLKDTSKEAYELYFDLHPDAKQYYRFINGNYEYDETVE